MSGEDINAAGTPLTDAEIGEISGAGNYTPVYKIEINCGECGRVNIIYTEDPMAYHREFMFGNTNCPACNNAHASNFSIIITEVYQTY